MLLWNTLTEFKRRILKMSTKKLLEEEIQSEIEEISKMEVGSDKHKAATEALAKLMDKYNEMDKLELEYQEKYDNREEDRRLKEKQLQHDKKDALVKNVLTGVSVVGGFALTIWGTCKSIKFEETGSFTTIMGRGFIQKLLPKK
jgi:hypothetical protein